MESAAGMRLGFSIPDYEIEQIIGRGATSLVYRAARDGKQFAIKVLKEAGSVELSVRFRREVAASARLSHPGLVRVLESGEHQGQPFLVMEYVDGGSLGQRIRSGTYTEQELIPLTRAVVEALVEVHRHGMVHRDIKPANILLETNGRPKLIDFGLVAGGAVDEGKREVVGTFLYAAPEQTGMLKRPVDARSDLYSLGAVLFECLTGEPPFSSDTLPDLLQKHAAEAARSVRDLKPAIGLALSAVVAKLLAKDPDDRYQTAQGLLADLDALGELESDARAGKPLRLGRKDIRGVLSGQQVPLVGRERELLQLEGFWLETRGGKRNVVQVEGEGGSGKTRLLRELLRKAAEENAQVLSGKCQQREAIAFGPLREAIDGLVAQILSSSDEAKARGLEAIRRAAGDFAAIVRRLSRGLQNVLSDAKEMGKLLSGEDEQRRFFEKVAQFFIDLPEHLGTPLVLVVDDVQWLDSGSEEILRRICTATPEPRILIATTARNDPASVPGRDRFVQSLDLRDRQRIILAPLELEAVGKLVHSHMGGAALPEAFVERLAKVTNGNPFAIGEFVRAMLDGGVLEPRRDGWHVDTERFNEIALSTDVFDLVVNRIGTLNASTRAVLNVAAVIGLRFPLSLVAEAHGGDLEVATRAIEEAVQASLVEQSGKDEFAFVHDRLLEALLNNLGEEALQTLHQAVAEALDRRGTNLSGEEVRALARSYARGLASQNPKRVYETNKAAGMIALRDYGNDEALEMLSRALASAKLAAIPDSSLTDLREALGEVCSRTGRVKEAREHLERALSNARNNLDIARIQYLIADSLFNAGEPIECWKYVEDALKSAGRPLPKSTVLRWVYLFWYWLLASVLADTGLRFAAAKGRRRDLLEVIHHVYEIAGPIAFVLGNSVVFRLVTIHSLVIAHELGPSREFVNANAWYTFTLGTLGLRKAAEEKGKLAASIGRQIGNGYAEWHGEQHLILAMHMCGEERNLGADAKHREYFPHFEKWLPPWERMAMVASYMTSQFWRGHTRESVRFAEEHLSKVENTGHLVMLSAALGALYAQLHILGRHSETPKVREDFLRAIQELGFVPWVQGMVYYFDMVAFLDQEDWKSLEESIQGYMQVIYESRFEDPWTRFGYMVVAEARFEQYVRAEKGRERRRARRNLKKAIAMARSRAWVPVYRCYLLAIEGAFAREEGKPRLAREKLEEAEDLATESDSALGVYLVARERARLAMRKGNEVAARKEASIALEIAVREGWNNRARRLRTEFAVEESAVGSSVGHTSSVVGGASTRMNTLHTAAGTMTGGGVAMTNMRYASALLQVSLASSSTLDADGQAKAALTELVRVLGAERGFLFLKPDTPGTGAEGELTLQAARDQAGKDLVNASGFSSTVVKEVAKTLRPVVMAGTEEGEALGSQSVVDNDLRSILAAPLTFREQLLGVVYLDSRLVRGLFTEDDLGILQAITHHIAIAFETAKVARTEANRHAMEKELALTAAVQSLFLPKDSTADLASCRVGGFYRPAAQCGGDWWWMGQGADGKARLLVGDVTGHGAASAMVTASVATSFRMLDHAGRPPPLAELLGGMSANLRATTGGAYRMTMSAAEVNPETGTLTWVNAGAPPLAILKSSGQLKVVNGIGTVLGEADFAPAIQDVALEAGDRVFFFTDGLSELRVASGRDLGLKKLFKLFQETKGLSLEDARRMVVEGLDSARQGIEQEDDITFAVLDYRPS